MRSPRALFSRGGLRAILLCSSLRLAVRLIRKQHLSTPVFCTGTAIRSGVWRNRLCIIPQADLHCAASVSSQPVEFRCATPPAREARQFYRLAHSSRNCLEVPPAHGRAEIRCRHIHIVFLRQLFIPDPGGVRLHSSCRIWHRVPGIASIRAQNIYLKFDYRANGNDFGKPFFQQGVQCPAVPQTQVLLF